MNPELTFELITPDGPQFSGQAYEVMMPTPLGQIAVLPNHRPLITIISPGVISIRRHAQDADELLEDFASAGGVAEISGHRVRALTDSAEQAENINELKAKAALAKAQELRATAADQVSLADVTGSIELNLARLKVAELKRKRRVR